MASNNGGYWSRSWELLTRDEGWHKPLLVLAAARLIPIVGTFGADGYGLEWARLTAWGVDSSPKQKNVDVGACIRAGARAFVVALGYMLAFFAVRVLIMAVFGEVLGSILSLLVTLAATVLTLVAKLRATIYQRIGAGYQVELIFQMIRRDYHGLLRVLGLILLLGFGYTMISLMAYGAVLVSKMAPLVGAIIEYDRYGYGDDWMIISALFSVLTSALPFLLVMSYVTGIVGSFVELIGVTAVGLWMRQFDVANWGDSSDPLPSEAPETSSSEGGYAKTSADWHAYRQDTGYGEPTAYTDTPHQADEPAMVYPIPEPRDDFPKSSAEMEQFRQREQELAAMQAPAEDDENALDTVKTFKLTYEDDEGVRQDAESPEYAPDVALDAYGAAEPVVPEQETPGEVPMFSLDSLADEPKPDAPPTVEPLTHDEMLAQAEPVVPERETSGEVPVFSLDSLAEEPRPDALAEEPKPDALAEEPKPDALSAAKPLTQDEMLAQVEAEIRAADMTIAKEKPQDEAADPQPEDPPIDEPHDTVED